MHAESSRDAPDDSSDDPSDDRSSGASGDRASGDLRNGASDGVSSELPAGAGQWQVAEPLGEWTLVGCTVAPGFDFARFELAPTDWQPGD